MIETDEAIQKQNEARIVQHFTDRFGMNLEKVFSIDAEGLPPASVILAILQAATATIQEMCEDRG